jgi:hypothetical protein
LGTTKGDNLGRPSKRGFFPIYITNKFKIMEKKIDIFGNLLMTINSIMDGKIN